MRAQLDRAERAFAEQLTPLTREVAELRAAKDDVERHELAAAAVVAMLAGALLLGFGRGSTSKLFRATVALLSVSNGILGVMLHWSGALSAANAALRR